jgi:predicted nucleotidyltransferase
MAPYTGNFKNKNISAKKINQAIDFLEDFMRWSKRKKDIRAVGLLGSYARENPTEKSDIDLVILAEHSQAYLTNTSWIRTFGRVIAQKVEEYGKLTSLRVWYESGLEVEYCFTTREWIQLLLDEGTKKAVNKGLRVLFEKEALLSPYDMKVGTSNRPAK